MKNLLYLFMLALGMISLVVPVSNSTAWNFNGDSPVGIVKQIQDQANKRKSQQVQNTKYDAVSSTVQSCGDLFKDSRFSIARTLCSLKELSRDYLQYFVYIGLSAATIFIIRNGFKIVTSSDREKQLGAFKKNMLYIIVGVVLLIGFYYVIDLFVSVVNLIAE